jgi:hypothetical protein
VKTRSNLVCEEMGNDVVVLDSESQSVLSVSGTGASVIKRVLAGELVEDNEPGVSKLVAQGILVTEGESTVSRRTLMVSGAAMGAGGVLALSLPGAAMASSQLVAPPSPSPSPSLLKTPVFTTHDGGRFINRRNVTWDQIPDQLTRLRFDAERLDNPGDYGDDFEDFELEWSFSETGTYRAFDFLVGDPAQFQWDADEDDGQIPIKLSDDPGLAADPLEEVDGLYTIFIRVRVGGLVSGPATVLFKLLDN